MRSHSSKIVTDKRNNNANKQYFEIINTNMNTVSEAVQNGNANGTVNHINTEDSRQRLITPNTNQTRAAKVFNIVSKVHYSNTIFPNDFQIRHFVL